MQPAAQQLQSGCHERHDTHGRHQVRDHHPRRGGRRAAGRTRRARRRSRRPTRRTWTHRRHGPAGHRPHRPRRLRERQRRGHHVPAGLRPRRLPHRPGAAGGRRPAHPAGPDRLGLPLQPGHRPRRHHEGPLRRRHLQRRGPATAGGPGRVAGRAPLFPGFEFYNGVSYRNLLVYRGPQRLRPEDPPAARDPRGADRAAPADRHGQRDPPADHGPLGRPVPPPRDQRRPHQGRQAARHAGLALGPGPRPEHARVPRPLRRRQPAA